MNWRFFSVSRPLLALSGRTAGIRRMVDTPFPSIAVAQLRQRTICSAISHASKGDFGTKRPISSSFQRKQRRERPLHPVLRLRFPRPCAGNGRLTSEKHRSPRMDSPFGRYRPRGKPPFSAHSTAALLSLRTPFPFAPLRPGACGAFRLSYFPYFHVPTSFPRFAAQCGRGGSRHFARSRTPTRGRTPSAHHRSRHRTPHFGRRGAPRQSTVAL